jgi:hypothetical protein
LILLDKRIASSRVFLNCLKFFSFKHLFSSKYRAAAACVVSSETKLPCEMSCFRKSLGLVVYFCVSWLKKSLGLPVYVGFDFYSVSLLTIFIKPTVFDFGWNV